MNNNKTSSYENKKSGNATQEKTKTAEGKEQDSNSVPDTRMSSSQLVEKERERIYMAADMI